MRLKRTTSSDIDFLSLVDKLNCELWERYGDIQAEYEKHNKVDNLDTVIVAYIDDVPAGCGCFKEIEPGTAELKRMFTDAALRGKGIASAVLKELEHWAGELKLEWMVLETGTRQHEAIAMYQKNGYTVIDNYGPYAGLQYSICMEKSL